MSTSTGRTTGSGVPTRQQLDELDALLKKMLELPVQAADESHPEPPPVLPIRPSLRPVPATEPIRSELPGYTVIETAMPDLPPCLTPSVSADPVQEQAAARLREQAEWQQYQSSWQPSAQTWGPLAETWRQKQPAALPEIPSFPGPTPPSVQTQTVEIPEGGEATGLASGATTASSQAAAASAQTAHSPGADTERSSFLLWPLLVINGCFDLPTYLLGPIGRWLRSAEGGNWLALLGLLGMVTAAILVVLDGIGWNW
jgi:hypothetical protein